MRRILLLLALTAVCALAPASAAHADFGIHDFDVTFTDSEGASQALAGSHPYEMKTSFAANLEDVGGGKELPEDAVRNLEIFQVPGFIGDQGAVPQCPTLDFLRGGPENATGCADSTVVGIAHIEASEVNGIVPQYAPLYNLEPTPGSAARLGFSVLGTLVTIAIGTAESSPFNLVARTQNVSQTLEFFAAEVTLWGVPADPRHDPLRGECLAAIDGESLGSSCTAGVVPQPFLTLPRACEGPLETTYATDSWQNPGPLLANGFPDLSSPLWIRGSAETHDDALPPNQQGMIGCASLGFGPTTKAKPSTASAESSSGMDFEIDVEDEGLKSVEGRADADLKMLEIAFPKGVTANPSAAEGLGVCTEAQYDSESLVTPSGGGCPGVSKLGTIEAETPILPHHPLRGSMYLAEQQRNPFHSLLALYTVIRDPELGVFVKFATKAEPDPKTGQIVATAADLPPYPLSHVDVDLRSGPRAPFVTPSACGTYATEARLTPSSGGPALPSKSTFMIDSGPGGGPCPVSLPFSPGFEAGAISNAASRYSPFSMRITRQDGEQDITRFSAILPPGEVAKIAGVPTCPDTAIEAAKTRSGREELAAPSCPAASQIGTVLGGAGVGTALTYVPGSLYLAGPYHGDQLSVVAIVPAVAGPFDVGTVVTRVALTLNEETGEAEVDGAASDPIPHILKGIPLKVRDLRVYVDRPNFTLNPTNCSRLSTRADIFGSGVDLFSPADDQPVAVASPYQASSCASLGFKPSLKLQLKGGTQRDDHPALHSVVTYPKKGSYANIGRAVVILPHSEFIDPDRIGNPCTRPQLAEGACPKASILGYAKAYTPLLDKPLQGRVYFLANGGIRRLPDIVADLNGQFHVVLVGAVDSVNPRNAKIRTTFASVPDAPVSRFELNLKGGKEGVIVNSANLCRAKRYASIQLRGQNGRRHDFRTTVQVKCKKKQGRAGR